MLTAPFMEEENKEAVWSYASSKCLGIDGFNFRFLEEFWNLFHDFHRYGKLVRGIDPFFYCTDPQEESSNGN